MGNKNYPIVIGKGFQKGILAYIDDVGSTVKLDICRLKKNYPFGAKFDLKDIESIETEWWICDRDTLKSLADMLYSILDNFN